MSQKERVEVVEACKYVDEVVLDSPWIPDVDYLDSKKARPPHSRAVCSFLLTLDLLTDQCHFG